MHKAIPSSIVLALLFPLSACAGALVDAPSLNKRAFEVSLEEMRSQAGQGIISDDSIFSSENVDRNSIGDSLDDDARAIWNAHIEADKNFVSQSSNAQVKVRNAKGAGFGSDNWSIAQVEISRLDRARAPSLKSLGALDKIIFTRLENKQPNDNIETLLQLQKFLQSDVETQSRFLDNLSNSLAYR